MSRETRSAPTVLSCVAERIGSLQYLDSSLKTVGGARPLQASISACHTAGCQQRKKSKPKTPPNNLKTSLPCLLIRACGGLPSKSVNIYKDHPAHLAPCQTFLQVPFLRTYSIQRHKTVVNLTDVLGVAHKTMFIRSDSLHTRCLSE